LCPVAHKEPNNLPYIPAFYLDSTIIKAVVESQFVFIPVGISLRVAQYFYCAV
jgi:hypothetical protein